MAERLTPLTSRIDALKRQLFDALTNPKDYLSMVGGRAAESLQATQQLQRQAFADPRQPFKVTDENALRQLTDMMMAGPLGFAPAGIIRETLSPNVTSNFLNKVQKFPSDYTEVVPQDAIVKASQLVPTQEKVSKSAVKLYKSGQGSMGDLPADVVFDKKTNQYFIVDGHHRIAAMLESGVDNIPVQIIGEK